MSGSLKREADFKREIQRLRRQRDEYRRLPAQLEAAQRDVKMWKESSEQYARENGELRQQILRLHERAKDVGGLGFAPA